MTMMMIPGELDVLFWIQENNSIGNLHIKSIQTFVTALPSSETMLSMIALIYFLFLIKALNIPFTTVGISIHQIIICDKSMHNL